MSTLSTSLLPKKKNFTSSQEKESKSFGFKITHQLNIQYVKMLATHQRTVVLHEVLDWFR